MKLKNQRFLALDEVVVITMTWLTITEYVSQSRLFLIQDLSQDYFLYDGHWRKIIYLSGAHVFTPGCSTIQVA
jgi:hypothetical protein